MKSARSAMDPALLAALLTTFYALFIVVRANDPLVLVTLGTRYAPDSLDIRAVNEEGYDGQFVYYLARYGADGGEYIDVPAYRAQRMLLPAFGALLSFGQSDWLPFSLLATNVISVALGTWALASLLMASNVSAWYGLGYALAIGVFGATRLTTTEPLAYGLSLLGIWFISKQHYSRGALLFALAGLAKETTFIFVAGYILHWLLNKQWARALRFGAIAILPFAFWQLVLFATFGAVGIGSGGNMATGFELIPFMGIVRIISDGSLLVFAVLMPLIGIFVLVPTLWAFWRGWQDWRLQQWSLITTLLVTQAGIMLFVPFSTYREPLGILRFVVGLQIMVIWYAAAKHQKRALRYSMFWIMTSLLVIATDYNTG